MDVSPIVGHLVGAIGWIVPAFSAFDVKAQVVHALPIGTAFVADTLVYAVVYIAAVLLAAVFLFSRREFR
jgi:hypothetical protein